MARPNFPKLAPVYRAACQEGLSQIVVHTGQHYDHIMSGSFFSQLAISHPDINLEVWSCSHALQTAHGTHRVCLVRPTAGWVLVYGDVNSTVAAALVAVKLGLRVAHVEVGLRSNGRSMPEEINRIATDHVADLLLTPSRDASDTLRAEGIPDWRIAFVGNVMIDSLFHTMQTIQEERQSGVVLVTLHRPSNVDNAVRLSAIATALREITKERPVLFAVHPRSRQRLLEHSKSGGG